MKLVLIGGGHAHVHILKQLQSSNPFSSVTLITEHPTQIYSGMVPGYLNGSYTQDQITFDLKKLCAKGGITCIIEKALRIDPKNKIIHTHSQQIPYDLCSCNIGSLLKGATPQIEKNTVLIKPINNTLALFKKIQERISQEKLRFVIVGAGAAGFEIACSLRHLSSNATITLCEQGDYILKGYSTKIQQLASALLKEKKITVLTKTAITSTDEHSITIGSKTVSSDLTLWLTGARGSSLFTDSSIKSDKRGFLLVNDYLQSLHHPELFGAGDCISLANYPSTPKAGVYAIRQSPILWHNLLAAANNKKMKTYTPQQSFLSLLNTADGKAIARYKGFAMYNAFSWKLKDYIDTKFMKAYQ